MIALLVILPILLIGVPVVCGWFVERMRELAFNEESRQLRDEFQGFWLNHSNVTYVLASLSSEAV